jgi:hypothetical protein
MGGSAFHLMTFASGTLPTLVWQETVTTTELINHLQPSARSASPTLRSPKPPVTTLSNEVGQRRIDDPGDWLRREIVEAFSHGLRVIPVLLDGVTLPAEAELPDDIAQHPTPSAGTSIPHAPNVRRGSTPFTDPIIGRSSLISWNGTSIVT